MSFFNELKRRNVFKVAAAYIIVGWLIGSGSAPARLGEFNTRLFPDSRFPGCDDICLGL